MTLISALLGIAADRLLPDLHEYRRYDLFLRYVDWMRERFSGAAWDHIGGLLVTLLPLWLVVGLLQLWISDWAFGLIGLLFYAAVLVYCLGPRDLAADVDAFCQARDSGDGELGRRAARLLLGRDANVEDSDGLDREVSTAVLVEASDRLFGVLFWFALLGPLGAVAYRSAAVLYQQYRDDGGFGDSVAWLYALLVWVPVRLVALGYALSGHFDAAVEGWRKVHQMPPQGGEGSLQVLAVTGAAALGVGEGDGGQVGVESVRAAMRLVWRTLVIWMVVIALLTLVGWTS
jgi:membrane protein required for beta-lactamase induction